MAAANRYLAAVYRPAFTAAFRQPAAEEGSAFVPWLGGDRDNLLGEQFERPGGHDNGVRFEGLTLQIPADRYRCHSIKVKVRVHRYLARSLAIFHGPRQLATYDAAGTLTQEPGRAAA